LKKLPTKIGNKKGDKIILLTNTIELQCRNSIGRED